LLICQDVLFSTISQVAIRSPDGLFRQIDSPTPYFSPLYRQVHETSCARAELTDPRTRPKISPENNKAVTVKTELPAIEVVTGVSIPHVAVADVGRLSVIP
jgi:hypothetical protein